MEASNININWSFRIWFLIACAALLLGLPGCASAVETRPLAVYEPGDCPILPRGNLEMECGCLKVLENRANPQSQTISLRVIVYKTNNQMPAPDPVVYLAGGPGSSGIDDVRHRMDDFQDILARRDLVVVDQRGTGYSRPSLTCPDYPNVFYSGLADHSFSELQANVYQALRDCQETLGEAGIDLSAYTNLDNAMDLEDLRLALGYKQWNLLGTSYGTRLALTILREYPAGVRSVILDSTYPPEIEPYSGWVLSLDRAFRVLFEACAAQERCHRAYPNLEQDFYTLVNKLDSEPLTVQAKHPLYGSPLTLRVDGDTLINLVFLNLYDTYQIIHLPSLIEDMLAGGTKELSNSIIMYLSTPYFVNWGMYYSVMCSAESDFTTFEQVQKDAVGAQPRLAQMMLNIQRQDLELCEIWDINSPEAEENQEVRSNVPALILAGEFDPVTPPAWGEHAAEGLKRARFYTFTGLTHGVTPFTYNLNKEANDCVNTLMMSFLENPTARPDDQCVKELPPLVFEIP